ncbi:MAG: hypothetical protein P1U64_13175 [Alcanivoracaceae bacterium]|nr:hypothetical protein [Alcanivoracaceae bacterium]
MQSFFASTITTFFLLSSAAVLGDANSGTRVAYANHVGNWSDALLVASLISACLAAVSVLAMAARTFTTEAKKQADRLYEEVGARLAKGPVKATIVSSQEGKEMVYEAVISQDMGKLCLEIYKNGKLESHKRFMVLHAIGSHLDKKTNFRLADFSIC